MDDFERIFEAYGADYQVTLGRFMGNRKMYMKFLGMLFQDENLSKLGNALEQGDIDVCLRGCPYPEGCYGQHGADASVRCCVHNCGTSEDKGGQGGLHKDV